jgi:hypothetical protein
MNEHGQFFCNTRGIMDTTGFILILLTGIVVMVLSRALDRIWAGAAPVRPIYLFIRFPGVVLHECSHIAGCIITGARIRNVVLFSRDGGSVTYTSPRLPFIGDVIISTAPLFLLPLALSAITWTFGSFLGCVFPAFPLTLGSPEVLADLFVAILGSFSDNLVSRFNGWFLLYLFLTISIVLSIAPSQQDMKNAAAGIILIILSGIIVFWSDIPVAVNILAGLVRLLGYGFTLGFVFGLVALFVSLPLLLWHAFTRYS